MTQINLRTFTDRVKSFVAILFISIEPEDDFVNPMVVINIDGSHVSVTYKTPPTTVQCITKFHPIRLASVDL